MVITIKSGATLSEMGLVWSEDISASLPRSHETGSQGLSKSDLKMPVDSNNPGKSWVWFPSTHDLKTHYVRTMTGKDSLDEAILISKCCLSCET